VLLPVAGSSLFSLFRRRSSAEGSLLPSLSLTSKDPATLTADALVLGVATGPSGPRLVGGEVLPSTVRTLLSTALGAVGASGAKDSVHRIPAVTGISARSVGLHRAGPGPGGGPD
jgi:leucyl aminopeptidase